MMKYIQIIIYSILLFSIFADAGEERHLVDVKSAVSEMNRISYDDAPESIAACKMRLSAVSGIEAYVSSSVNLAVANEFEYLEYCWLKAKDPVKRKIIASVILSLNIQNEDWEKRFFKESKRYANDEQDARIDEINWGLNNKVWFAQTVAKKLEEDKKTKDFIKLLVLTARPHKR